MPGVVALGADRAEVSERLEEPVAAYTNDLRERGEKLPAAHHAVGTIAA